MPRTELCFGAGSRAENWGLPSSTIFRKIIVILENKEYMSMMKEKLTEIKRVYRDLKLSSVSI